MDSMLRAAHRESLITHELATVDPVANVLRRLAHALATSDAVMLDTLAYEAARVCSAGSAGSAGISVLESPPVTVRPDFAGLRSRATARRFSIHIDHSTAVCISTTFVEEKTTATCTSRLRTWPPEVAKDSQQTGR